mmetsp:Transcript_8762/g.12406  ORF Transcript_8762/g.12406 Transcript_8762/m.12406 type:complete len:379 (-) Transcript_8762:202-1338(-)
MGGLKLKEKTAKLKRQLAERKLRSTFSVESDDTRSLGSMFRWTKRQKSTDDETISTKGFSRNENTAPVVTYDENLNEMNIPATVVARSRGSKTKSAEEPSMLRYAVATADIAKKFYDEDSQSGVSKLYKPNSSPLSVQTSQHAKYKRSNHVETGIFKEKQNTLSHSVTGYGSVCSDFSVDSLSQRSRSLPNKSDSSSYYSGGLLDGVFQEKQLSRTYSSDSGSPNFLYENKRILSEPNHALPTYSVAGSMIYNDMEKKDADKKQKRRAHRAGDTSDRKFLSPQKPTGLPPNTIMASMLFRTLHNDDPSKNEPRVPAIEGSSSSSVVSARSYGSSSAMSVRSSSPSRRGHKNSLQGIIENTFEELHENPSQSRNALYEA